MADLSRAFCSAERPSKDHAEHVDPSTPRAQEGDGGRLVVELLERQLPLGQILELERDLVHGGSVAGPSAFANDNAPRPVQNPALPMILRDILPILDAIAPLRWAEPWDNTGLLTGEPTRRWRACSSPST